MQDPSEPSSIKPLANEGLCDPVNTAQSKSQDSATQTVVPANFVEVFHIPPIYEEAENEDGIEDDSTCLLGEELLPSQVTLAAMTKAYDSGHREEAARLAYTYCAQRNAEAEAEKQAQARAAEEKLRSEDSSADDDREEFPEEESEIQPDDQIRITVGGHPAKTAGLRMTDLIRPHAKMEKAQYVSPEDGIINQFSKDFGLPWGLKLVYDSLILPTRVEGFRTTRELFDDISSLLHKYVTLSTKHRSLLAYWAIATWFPEYLPFLPSVVISGPAPTADMLLRTLAAVCRRPILLGELSPAILRRLAINEITPTLLIREPQLSRYTSALLNSSNQPGYLFLSGDTLQPLYCPKCIYVGERFKDSSDTRDSLHINLSGVDLTSRHAWPAKDEITSFQNRLLCYRLLNHEKVAAANFRVSGFRPEVSIVADVLAAAIVDNVEQADLQRGIIEVLKDRDEQSRVDRATGVNGVVLRAVLFHCHQKDQRKFVREIAETANRLYAEDGESLRVNSEKVGHVLKYLGLYSHRLGNAGRGLIFEKTTQFHAHKLSHAYDVLTSEPDCEYCHQFQQPQTEEVVQEV